MKKYTYLEIREKFLNFQKKHGHIEIPNEPLVIDNDPSLLFVNAGMIPLVPFLLGETHPLGKRLTNVQRCIRTIDIDNVGDRHHCTSFEMLGNWSLDDYFKGEAITLLSNFFIEELGYDVNNLYATVFCGDQDAPEDSESVDIWKKFFKSHGIDAKLGRNERIQPLPHKHLPSKSENWWELESGGPCGPCSEIFYDTGIPKCGPECDVACSCGKYSELGNNVFMEYLKKDGSYTKMNRHNVDFGGGLDRQTFISQQVESVYDTDIYLPIYNKVQELSLKTNNSSLRSQRIITDHLKAATWIVMDGIVPTSSEQGYVLRRLIRRAVRHGLLLGIGGNFTRIIGEVAIDQFSCIYPQLHQDKELILSVIEDEENKFRQTLIRGALEFDRLLKEKGTVTGKDAFYLYETYGYPFELVHEMAQEKGVNIDESEYNSLKVAHSDKSRTSAKGFFKGGLADTTDASRKYHTATHLLNAALNQVLSQKIVQKGSNINPLRLRFDFSLDRRLTDFEINQVEKLINEQISLNLPVTYDIVDKDKALIMVPNAMFSDRYGDKVKVYYVGDRDHPFSIEICNGPHVDNTGQLSQFKIIKQENVGSGIKRIKAVLI